MLSLRRAPSALKQSPRLQGEIATAAGIQRTLGSKEQWAAKNAA